MPKPKKPKIKVREIKSKIKIIEQEKEEDVEKSEDEFGELSEHSREAFSPRDSLSRSQIQPAFQAIPQEAPRDVSAEVSSEAATERNRAREAAVGYATARSQQGNMTETEREDARRRGYESQTARNIIAPQINTNALRRSSAQQFSSADNDNEMSPNRQRIQTGEPSMFRSEGDETKKYDFNSQQSDAQRKRRRMF